MQEYEIGDRVVVCDAGDYLSSMQDAHGTVIWIEREWDEEDRAEYGDNLGIEFDETVGYGHDCYGHGSGGGHNAFVRAVYVCPETTEFNAPCLDGFFD